MVGNGSGREGRMKRWNTEDFEGSEAILCDTLTVDTYLHASVQIQRMHNTESKPSVNHGRWVTVVCWYRFTSCNQCGSLVGEVVGREVVL